MSDFSLFDSIMPYSFGWWQTTADMPFDLIYGDVSTRVIVPSGFITDGPSVPAIARIVFNPNDSRYMKAAIIHDWLLAQGIYTPRQCAAAFADALRAAKVSRWRIAVMWASVFVWTYFTRL